MPRYGKKKGVIFDDASSSSEAEKTPAKDSTDDPKPVFKIFLILIIQEHLHVKLSTIYMIDSFFIFYFSMEVAEVQQG